MDKEISPVLIERASGLRTWSGSCTDYIWQSLEVNQIHPLISWDPALFFRLFSNQVLCHAEPNTASLQFRGVITASITSHLHLKKQKALIIDLSLLRLGRKNRRHGWLVLLFFSVHFPLVKCLIWSNHVEVKRVKVAPDQFLTNSDEICNKIVTQPRCR